MLGVVGAPSVNAHWDPRDSVREGAHMGSIRFADLEPWRRRGERQGRTALAAIGTRLRVHPLPPRAPVSSGQRQLGCTSCQCVPHLRATG